MEVLKKREELESPDERNLYFVVSKSVSGAKRLSLDEIYSEVSQIQLHDGVPSNIRGHFSQAQNLAVYSWYYYPFNVTSQLMAFASVELALRKRVGKQAGLKFLIREAVTNGWIKDEGFTITKYRDTEISKSYVETLIDTIPYLRNKLAHGSSMLHNNSLSSLLICAELINQLFVGLENG